MTPSPTAKARFWQPLIDVVKTATEPGGPMGMLVDVIFGVALTFFATATGMLHYTVGRALYALFITVLALSLLISAKYYVALHIRWWRIRRAGR